MRAVVPLVTAAVLGLALAGGLSARSQTTPALPRAMFTASGEARLPVGYREWRHVGTRLRPIGISILDGKPTPSPEIYNAYIEPTAYAAYRRTGQWPDGTQMVKEFTAVRVGAGCDAVTYRCSGPLGEGIFEAGFIGLGMMIKDAQRFPDTPGHWGYFEFGHHAPPYNSTSVLRPQTQCSACHVRLASDTDYVITAAHVEFQNPGGG